MLQHHADEFVSVGLQDDSLDLVISCSPEVWNTIRAALAASAWIMMLQEHSALAPDMPDRSCPSALIANMQISFSPTLSKAVERMQLAICA